MSKEVKMEIEKRFIYFNPSVKSETRVAFSFCSSAVWKEHVCFMLFKICSPSFQSTLKMSGIFSPK